MPGTNQHQLCYPHRLWFVPGTHLTVGVPHRLVGQGGGEAGIAAGAMGAGEAAQGDTRAMLIVKFEAKQSQKAYSHKAYSGYLPFLRVNVR